MSDFSFKNNKQIEIIKEMVKTSSDRYEINGIELSKARFMWRKFQEAFQILSPGSYSIIQEAGNTFLKIDDTVLLGEAIEFQVIYVFDQESSQYIDDFPDVSILKEKYNELQRDFTNLNRLLKSNNITGDTLKMFYVLPELNEGEVWIRTKDGWRGTNVADLDKIVQDLINKIETEIKPDLALFIKTELAKAQVIIDGMLTHDYIDIPFLNKDVVQIYIDTDTKTVRECDNTKFEPLSAVGLKFIKEDGATVTRCYFRGVYDKPTTLNIQDGVYWQTHTSVDGLTLIQPQKWKSQAFELSNGKMYFDRGNPILIQGELGTIIFKEYETLNQAKADSSLVSGDYVIVTGDTQTNDGGQGVYQLVNGIFELRDFNRSFLGQKLDKQDTIEDLKKSTQYAVGDVVQVLGYYTKGDGGGHPRIKKPVGYNGTDAVIGADGSIWGIVHNGEVDISWFGAKPKYNNAKIFVAVATYINSLKSLSVNFRNLVLEYDPSEFALEFQGYGWRQSTELVDVVNVKLIGNKAILKSTISPIYKTGETPLTESPFQFRGTFEGGCKNITITGVSQIGVRSHGAYPTNYINDGNDFGWCFRQVNDVLIEDLECSNWRTDGIYIGNTYNNIGKCKNITINNCVLDSNQRQGISLTAYEDVTINNCKIKNTGGSSFGHAIDSEPNGTTLSKNLNIINCFTENNERGFFNFIRTSNILISNCNCIEHNSNGTLYCDGFSKDVYIINSYFSAKRSVVYFLGKNVKNINFNNCHLSTYSNSDNLEIVRQLEANEVYGLFFNNCNIKGDGGINTKGDNVVFKGCNIELFKGAESPTTSTRHSIQITGKSSKIIDTTIMLDSSIENEVNVFYCPYTVLKGNTFVNNSNQDMIIESSQNEALILENIFTEKFYYRNSATNQTIKEYANIDNTIAVGSSVAENGVQRIKNSGYAGTKKNTGSKVGDVIFSIDGVGNLGYVCTVAGNPGTWIQIKYVTPTFSLDTPYHASNMQKLGILDSYHQYLTELHEYEKSQNVQSNTGVMNLNVIQPPTIPTEVEAYAKEYNLI